jgi:hypothetical protein
VGGTREEGQSTGSNRDDWLFWVVRCVATTRTVESSSGTMVEEFRAIFSGELTERAELLKMLVTPDQWNRELVHKQEGNALSPR